MKSVVKHLEKDQREMCFLYLNFPNKGEILSRRKDKNNIYSKACLGSWFELWPLDAKWEQIAVKNVND